VLFRGRALALVWRADGAGFFSVEIPRVWARGERDSALLDPSVFFRGEEALCGDKVFATDAVACLVCAGEAGRLFFESAACLFFSGDEDRFRGGDVVVLRRRDVDLFAAAFFCAVVLERPCRGFAVAADGRLFGRRCETAEVFFVFVVASAFGADAAEVVRLKTK